LKRVFTPESRDGRGRAKQEPEPSSLAAARHLFRASRVPRPVSLTGRGTLP
jgi:hypothetical protein